MTKKFRILSFFVSTVLILVSLSFPSEADETKSNHTLGSGEDVYRIELNNLGPLRVISTGEKSNGKGEFHKVEMTLQAGNQFHTYSETSRGLVNQNDRRGDEGYLSVGLNDTIRFRDNARPRFWVHAKKWGLEFPTVVTFKVTATELDCVGQRVCNSGNKGTLNLSFDIPKFITPPPRKCGSSNTFNIKNELYQEGLIEGLQGRYNYNGGTFGRSGIIASGATPMANLQPTSGQICIASTAGPFKAQTTHFIQNRATQKCLSMPIQVGVTPDTQAKINSCMILTPGSNAEIQKWYLDHAGDDKWAIRSNSSDQCLNLKKSRDDHEGGPVKAVGCSGHPDQLWERDFITRDTMRLKNVASGKCLNVHSGREDRQWGNVSVYSCSSNNLDQIWQLLDL